MLSLIFKGPRDLSVAHPLSHQPRYLFLSRAKQGPSGNIRYPYAGLKQSIENESQVNTSYPHVPFIDMDDAVG